MQYVILHLSSFTMRVNLGEAEASMHEIWKSQLILHSEVFPDIQFLPIKIHQPNDATSELWEFGFSAFVAK